MPTTHETGLYLRPAELAATLRVTTRTLCRWRKSGKGPDFVREGRVVRYRSSDIDAWSRASH